MYCLVNIHVLEIGLWRFLVKFSIVIQTYVAKLSILSWQLKQYNQAFKFLFSPTSLRKISATILVSSYDFMNELSQAYVLLDYENGILVKSPEIPMT